MAKRKLEELTENELLFELLWKKHAAIDPYKVISSETAANGGMYVKLGGKKIADNELVNLQSEGKMIEGTRLWKILVETLTSAAEDSIFKSSKNMEDIHYGKTMLFNLSVLKNILSILQRPHLNQDPTKAVNTQNYATTRHPSL
jgi:hypothetical protein